MKLFFSPNSPYARKCRVLILEKGLEASVELVSTMPADNSPELILANPLGTVPTLLLDNGFAYCESPIICEYLDSLSGKNTLFPKSQAERFEALAMAALADGVMDAAVACVMERRRPLEIQYQPWVQRKEAAIMRTIAKIAEFDLENYGWNIGTLGIAVALEYVNLRFPNLCWQNEHEKLADWLKIVSQKSAMLATSPT